MKNFTKYLILLLTLTLGLIGSVKGQNRFWIGGATTGTLTDGTKWSATLGGAAIGGTLTVTVGQYYIVDGTDLNGTAAGAGVGPVGISIATATVAPGQFIVRNGNVVVNVTGTTSTNTLVIGSTSAASNTGFDFEVGSGCTLNLNSGNITLASTSNATAHQMSIAGTLNIAASRTVTVNQGYTVLPDATNKHIISGAVNLTTSSSLLDFANTTTSGRVNLDITGTVNINGSGARLGFVGTSTNSRVYVGSTGVVNVTNGTMTWGGSGNFNSPAGGFVVDGTVNYNAAGAQTLLDDMTINATGNLVLAGSGAKTVAIGIDVYGKLSRQGTATTTGTAVDFLGTASTYELKGSSAQTIILSDWSNSVAASPYNLIIDNAAGVSLTAGSRTIQGTLTLKAGVFTIPASTTLTFQTGDTPIVRDGVTNTGTITMNATSNLVFGISTAQGGAAFTIPDNVFTSAPTFNNFTVDRTNRLTLNNQNITTTGTFTLTNGVVALGSGDLQVATLSVSTPSATRMIATSATSGYLKRSFTTSSFQSFTYPIGELVGTAEYNGFTFYLDANSTTRVIGWKVVDGIHPSMNTPTTPTNYLSRYYSSTVSPSTGTYDYDVDLPYNGTTGDIVGTESLIGAARWNGSAWVGTEASVNGTSDVIRFATNTDEIDGPLGFDVTGRAIDIDAPCGAVNVTAGAAGAGCTNVVTGNTLGATQTFSGGSCGTADDDVWFKFTATATSHTVRVTPSASFAPAMQVYYNAACASITSGSNINSCSFTTTDGQVIEQSLTGLTIGQVYYFRVWEYSTYASPPALNSFDVCVITPPANDEPCGAIALTANAAGSTTCSSPTSGNTSMASQTYSSGTCSFASTANDVWYRFVATASSHTISVTGNGTFDPVVQAYTLSSGTCPSATFTAISGACRDATGAGATETLQLTGLTTGVTYYYRVHHASSTIPSNTSFTTCVFTPNVNNEYCNGSTVTATTLTPGSTCSTITGDAVYASQTFSSSSCNFASTANDMWYRFQATATSISISVTGNGTFDPVVTAYSAGTTSTCPVTPTAISGACVDATGTGGTENLQLSGLTVNNWYYVRVYHASSTVPSNTTFTICAVLPPANDEPCNAVTVNPNAAGSTTCSAPTSGSATLASQTYSSGSCSFASTANDVWYRFVATASSHTISVTGNGTFDPVVQAYTLSSGTCPSATFTAISGACRDATGAGATETLQLTGLTTGVTYYYRVHHASSTVPSNTSFTTCVFTPNVNNEYCNGSTVTATTLSPGSTCSTITGDAVYASQTFSSSSCNFASTANDMWYRFQATTTSISITVTGNGTFDPVVTAYSAGTTSTCPVTPTAIPGACIDNTGAGGTETLSLTGLTVNNWYYVRVYHASSTVPSNTTFTICAVLPPTNDDCSGAFGLTLGTGQAGTTVGATNSGASSYCGSSTDDVWYSFTAPASGSVTITLACNAGFDGAFNLRGPSTCPASGTDLVCMDYSGTAGTETLRITGLTSGTVYRVRVMKSSSFGTSGTFTITVANTYSPSGNDNVASASTAIVGNTTGNSSTTHGMQLGEPVGSDWFFSGGVADPITSQWFVFTPSTTSCYTVAATAATPSTSFDSEIAIYTATNISNFATYTEVASNEDISSNTYGYNSLNGVVAVTLNAGTTYYIQVGMYPYTSGTPTLRIVDRAATVPVATAATATSCTGFTANWNAATNAASYQLDVATDAAFTSIVSGYNSLNVGNVTTYVVSGLPTGNNFYYRVRAVNACGTATANSNVITITNAPAQPGAFTASTATVCGSQTGVVYTVPFVSGVTYNWSYSGTGATINGTGNSVTVDFASATPGTLSVTATACTITSAPQSIAISITPNVGTPSFTAGAATLCEGATSTYTATASNSTGVTYSIFSGGATIDANTGAVSSVTSSFVVRATATGTCGANTTQDFAVTVNPLPATVVATAGTGATTTSIVANWGAAANATSYILEVSTVSNFASTVFNGNVGNVTSYSVGSLTASTTYYYRVTAVNACGNAAVSNTITYATTAPIGGFTWTGATSTDWNTASNWSGGAVPSANDDIIIPNQTNDPVLTVGANGVCKSVTINSGATVTINTGKTIDVKGNWTGANNTVSGAGDLIFSGTTAQTISGGATISNLQINNTSGVTVAAGGNLVNVTTALKLKAGQLTTNGNVKTISTVSNTAYIDDFSPTFAGTISGNVAVERYVTAGPNGYRYIGAPVATTAGGSTLALSALSGFVISGTPGQLIPLPTCSPNNSAMNSPYATFMRWEEAGPYLLNCRQSGWWFQTTGTMAIGRGYGAKLSGGNKITYTGAANTGNSPAYTCTSTNIFAPSLNGWNLVSNPFPSNIRIDNTDGNADNNMPAGFDGQVQFYQTSGPFTGTFVTFNAGTSSPPILPIALGQGFWVKVSNTGTANWSLSNDHRITTGATYYSTNVVEDHLNITVSGNGFMDQTDINFLPEATPGFDFYDASKWLSANGQPTLYTKIGEDLISINSNPSLENTVAIPMGLLPGADGEFTFNFNDIATFPQSSMIVLEDLQLDSLVDLRQTTTYTFTQLETDSADRFIIHFQPGITATVVDQDCDNATGSITFTQNGTTVWDTYNVKDNSNNTYAQGVNYTGTITVNNLPPQEYILNLTHSSGYSTQEFVTVNNNGTPITLSLAVADTTVLIGETVNFTATATGATNYAWDFGDSNTAQGGLTQQHTYAAVGEYLVTVTATNDSCSKAESKTVYVGTVGINNTTASNLVIFGQGERVVVQFNNWGGNKADIFMYNTLGQRVESLTGVSTLKGRQEINVAGIKPGYYLIQVVSDGKIQSKKIYLGNY